MDINYCLGTHELLNSDYLREIRPGHKRTGKIPVWDDYRVRSKINNLPRTISCNSDLCLRHRFIKALFMVPQLVTLFNLPDYLFVGLTVGLTALMVQYNVVYQPDVGTLITLVLFPLTFALGNSFSRRSETLTAVSKTRSTAINLVFTVCLIANRLPFRFAGETPAVRGEKSRLGFNIIRAVKGHLQDCINYAVAHHERDRIFNMQRIYCRLNQINWLVGRFVEGESDPPTERLSGQYIGLVEEFEHFRTVIDYKSSTSVGYYLRALTIINTLFLTPWFAGFIKSSNNAAVLGYLLTGSIVASLLGLYRIQQRLENPVGNDWDDINIKAVLDPDLLLQYYRLGQQPVDITRVRQFLGRSDWYGVVESPDTSPVTVPATVVEPAITVPQVDLPNQQVTASIFI